MRAGEFPNGARVLRAKIDMASRQHQPARSRCSTASCTPRIRARATPGASIRPTISRTASPTRSRASRIRICTLEFEDHRPLYDWFLDNLPVPSRPRQYEFARLNIDLHGAVQARADRAGARGPRHRLGRSAHADPRGPAPARRAARGDPRFRPAHRRRQGQQRGRSPACSTSRSASCSTSTAPRRMAVLRPLKVVIENYPGGQVEELEAVNNPEDRVGGHAARSASAASSMSSATISWRTRPRSSSASRPAGGAAALRLFRHLPRGGEGRGRRGGGAALHLRSGDPRRQRAARRAQGAGDAALGRRPRTRSPAEVRLYNPLFTRPDPGAGGDFMADLNPELAGGAAPLRCSSRRSPAATAGEPVQFERQGYFCRDRNSRPGARVQPHRRPARHLGQGVGGSARRQAGKGLAPPPPGRVHAALRDASRSTRQDESVRLLSIRRSPRATARCSGWRHQGEQP